MKKREPEADVAAAKPKYAASSHNYVSLQIHHGYDRYDVLPLTLTKDEALDLSRILAEKAAELP